MELIEEQKRLGIQMKEIGEVKSRIREGEIEKGEFGMEGLDEEMRECREKLEELEKECNEEKRIRELRTRNIQELESEMHDLEFKELQYISQEEVLDRERQRHKEQERILDEIWINSIDRAPALQTLHKSMLNEVIELKGNIRVFCRLRPIIHSELSTQMGVPLTEHFNILPDRHHIQIKEKTEQPTTYHMNHMKKNPSSWERKFEFDHIFKSGEGQEAVFKEIGPFINCVLDGYSVCIFAYGHTGSGKTYTMEGGNDMTMEAEIGIIPRSVNLIFFQLEHQRRLGWQFVLTASMVQLYCGKVKDLLNPANECSDPTKLSKFQPTTHIVQTSEKIFELMGIARSNRKVGKTELNDKSSRSHSIFKLHLQGINDITGDNIFSALNLIDLAGSERLAQTKADGQRLKETQYINQSLTNLKNVIHHLATNQPHIPYRNDKLTTILEPHLGGKSKTLMFVNISPYLPHKQDSLNSLHFAQEVNNTYLIHNNHIHNKENKTHNNAILPK